MCKFRVKWPNCFLLSGPLHIVVSRLSFSLCIGIVLQQQSTSCTQSISSVWFQKHSPTLHMQTPVLHQHTDLTHGDIKGPKGIWFNLHQDVSQCFEDGDELSNPALRSNIAMNALVFSYLFCQSTVRMKGNV